jgi:hypothetical protein
MALTLGISIGHLPVVVVCGLVVTLRSLLLLVVAGEALIVGIWRPVISIGGLADRRRSTLHHVDRRPSHCLCAIRSPHNR